MFAFTLYLKEHNFFQIHTYLYMLVPIRKCDKHPLANHILAFAFVFLRTMKLEGCSFASRDLL